MSAASVTLKYLLLADDRASALLRRTGNEVDRTTQHMTKMQKVTAGLKVAGAAAGAGLLAVFKTGFDEAKDAADGNAQLAAGIKSTGNAANVTVAGLDNLAGSIQSYSGQTDDSIVASEKLLLTFTNIHNQAGKNNDIFNQATKATADMAAKMGGDASKYAKVLGKALNDPIKGVTALSRVGVTFTDGQKEQIKALVDSGHTMQAQKMILGELNAKYGGSAEAAGKTLPGQLARARRAFEDIAQSVVEQLMPILTALANFLVTKVMPIFKAVTDFIMAHKTTFEILAAVIGTVVVAVKAWTIAQAAFNFVMEANPVMLLVAGIAALVVALVVAYKKSETFRAIVQGVMRAVKNAIGWVITAFKDVISIVRTVIGWVRQHWPLLLAIITGPIGMAVYVIRNHISQIVGFFRSIPSRIVGVIAAVAAIGKRLGLGLWNGIVGIIGDIGGIGKSLYNAVAQSINWLIDKIRDWHFTIGAFGVHHTFQPFGGIPEIPMMAKGGVVTSPTLAMIGEAGPEAVVPLSKAGRFGLGAGHGGIVNINIGSGAILGTPAEVGRAVGKALEYAGNQGVKIRIGKAIV